MPIDYTIPLKAGTGAQTNPLQSALQAAQFRMASLNSQALQQGIDANNAASQAFKESTDANGNTDYNKFRSIMASGAGAYNLPQINNSILEAQQKQQTLDTGKLEQSIKTQTNLRQGLGSLMQKPDLSPNDVLGFMSTQLQAGAVTPQVVAAEIQSMPSDPGQLRQWLTQHYQSALSGETQLRAMTPTPTLVDQGGTAKYVDTNALTNPGIIGTQFTKTLTPSEQVTQTATYQNGQPGTKPMAQVAREQGLGNLVPGGTPGQSISNGRYPGAQGGGGFNPTQAPTGESTAMEGSAKQWDADRANAGNVAGRIYQLQSALGALQKGDTGPGSDAVNNAKSFLLARTDLAKYLPGVDPEKVQAYDEANKYLTQYASAKAGSLGASTDFKLATTLAGNASTHISNLAAQDVVKANIGLERMDKAMTDAFAATGLPANQYANWKLQWAGKVDPRVFIADVSPDKVQAAYKKMTPKEQAQFRTTYNWAVQNGYIEGPK